MDIPEAAEKAGVTPERLEAWEAGTEQLSIAQLKALASAYRRPVSVFYLPEPPQADFHPLKDFRRLTDIPRQKLSRSLAYEIRAAHERRLIAIELAETLGEDVPKLGVQAKRTDNPETVAQQVRERLGITLQQQARWGAPDKAFKAWRDTIEAHGILVSVLSGSNHQVPLVEARGFAIAGKSYPMIVVNGKDRGYGRIFTLLHELGHIVLGQSVLENDFEPDSRLPAPDRAIETFCNRFAAAVLMPRELLLSETTVVGKPINHPWEDIEIAFLSRRYSVSRQALIVRLAALGRAENTFVKQKLAEFDRQQRVQDEIDDEDGGGPVKIQYRVLSHLGRGFARLVLQAYNSRQVTLSTASGYLGTQAKYVPRIEQATFMGPGAA